VLTHAVNKDAIGCYEVYAVRACHGYFDDISTDVNYDDEAGLAGYFIAPKCNAYVVRNLFRADPVVAHAT
jgi:hypothetical protein